MTCKTHMAIGAATAITVVGTKDIRSLIVGITVALIGAIAPDMDIKNSEGGKLSTLVVAMATMVLLLNVVLEYYFSAGFIQNKNTIVISIIGIGILLLGKISKHRTFTHSLLGVLIYSQYISIVLGNNIAEWFIIGYISHIVADLFNKKDIVILYPFNFKLGFNLCKSNGKINSMLFYIFIIIGLLSTIQIFLI